MLFNQFYLDIDPDFLYLCRHCFYDAMVYLNNVPVDCNFPQIRRHVPGGYLLHFLFYQCPFFFGNIELDLYCSFSSAHGRPIRKGNLTNSKKEYIIIVKVPCQIEGDKIMKNRVEELRKARKLSQDEFAKAIRVSRQTVSSIETGKYNPSLELAFTISDFFEMSIEEIFINERSAVK